MTRSIFEERWTHRPEGQALCALISGERGWLMFLRSEGDAGMSSRDPAYSGPPDAEMEFQLTNGQLDRYPVAWTLPIQDIERAIEFFKAYGEPAPFVRWIKLHSDDAPKQISTEISNSPPKNT